MISFGKRLASYRKERDLTQKELAHKLGISLNTYKHLEYKTEHPKLDTLIKVLNALDVTLDQFLPELCGEVNNLPEDIKILIGQFSCLSDQQKQVVSNLIESYLK